MLESLDNSNGIQYYGGNDPAKMGGRFKKGGGGSRGGGTRSTALTRLRERVFSGNFSRNSTSPRAATIRANLTRSALARAARTEAGA